MNLKVKEFKVKEFKVNEFEFSLLYLYKSREI